MTDNINMYEWKAQVIAYQTNDERHKYIYELLSELRECGFIDIKWLGGITIYVTGCESNWADLIMSSPDLYDKLTKPIRIYYEEADD